MNCNRTTGAWLMVALTALGLVAAGRTAAGDEAKKEDKAAAKTMEVKIKAITMVVPATWKSERPSNNLRLAQFALPAAEGDKLGGELTIFSFGRSGVKANIERWIGQFNPQGRKAAIYKGESKHGGYYLLDVQGIYNRPIGPPIRRQTKPTPGSRMLGVILDVKGSQYFFKLTGPNKTVGDAATALRTSFGADIAKEKAFTLD